MDENTTNDGATPVDGTAPATGAPVEETAAPVAEEAAPAADAATTDETPTA